MTGPMPRHFLYTLCCLLTLGLFSVSVISVEAAPKNKKNKRAKKGPLAQLDKEVRTVKVNKAGAKGSLEEQQKAVHVLYSTATMEAFIDTSGDLYIQPLVADPQDSVSGTMMLNLGMRFLDHSGEYPKIKGCKVKTLSSSATPGKNPKQVTLTLELARGGVGTAVYSFDGKGFTVDFDVKDPRGLDEPTRHYMFLKVPVSHDLAVDASDKVKKKATQACVLDLKVKKYDYVTPSKGVGKSRGTSGSIAGHWPGYKIMLSGKPGLGLQVYGGSMLYKGYAVNAGDPDKPSGAKRFGIQVVKAP